MPQLRRGSGRSEPDAPEDQLITARWGTGALGHWGTGALGHWDTGALGHWGTGALGHWGTGALGHWGTGALGHWGTGALGHWGTGALGHWGMTLHRAERSRHAVPPASPLPWPGTGHGLLRGFAQVSGAGGMTSTKNGVGGPWTAPQPTGAWLSQAQISTNTMILTVLHNPPVSLWLRRRALRAQDSGPGPGHRATARAGAQGSGTAHFDDVVRRILPSGTWDRADSSRNSAPLPDTSGTSVLPVPPQFSPSPTVPPRFSTFTCGFPNIS